MTACLAKCTEALLPARRHGILPHLGVGAVGGKGADILQVNELPPTGQGGGNNHGDYPGSVYTMPAA